MGRGAPCAIWICSGFLIWGPRVRIAPGSPVNQMLISLDRTHVPADMQERNNDVMRNRPLIGNSEAECRAEAARPSSWDEEIGDRLDSFNWLVFQHRRRSTVSLLKMDDRVSAQIAPPKKHSGQNHWMRTINEYFRNQCRAGRQSAHMGACFRKVDTTTQAN